MIQFRPFSAIRPAKQKAINVTSKNVDFYSEEEMRKVLEEESESFLQVIKPCVLSSKEKKKNKYERVRENFIRFKDEGVLIKDRKSFYIYEQETEDEHKTIGIIGLVSIDNFKKGLIKKHENTLKKREEAFGEYLKSIHLQADPILLTYPENQSIELIMSMTTRNTPTLEFVGIDNNTHRLWQVRDRLVMKQLKAAIEKLPALYIADGHHRMGSSALYTEHMQKEEPDYFGGEAFNFAMAILVGGNHLEINDYNRLVTDLNGLSKEEFLEKIGDVFTIIDKDEPYFPSHKHHISMYLDGKFYGLYVNQEYRGIPKGLGELDTYLWEQHIMKPILGIEKYRKDKRLAFSKGTGDIKGILKMKERVDSGEFEVAFGFYPISVDDLQLVADEEQNMPPKSTYIKPKFLSALTILDLTD